jgi:hypothetical protein
MIKFTTRLLHSENRKLNTIQQEVRLALQPVWILPRVESQTIHPEPSNYIDSPAALLKKGNLFIHSNNLNMITS